MTKAEKFGGDARLSYKVRVNTQEVNKGWIEFMEQGSARRGVHNGPPDTPCGPLGLPSLEPSGITRARLIRGRVNKDDRIEIFNKNN